MRWFNRERSKIAVNHVPERRTGNNASASTGDYDTQIMMQGYSNASLLGTGIIDTPAAPYCGPDNGSSSDSGSSTCSDGGGSSGGDY